MDNPQEGQLRKGSRTDNVRDDTFRRGIKPRTTRGAMHPKGDRDRSGQVRHKNGWSRRIRKEFPKGDWSPLGIFLPNGLAG